MASQGHLLACGQPALPRAMTRPRWPSRLSRRHGFRVLATRSRRLQFFGDNAQLHSLWRQNGTGSDCCAEELLQCAAWGSMLLSPHDSGCKLQCVNVQRQQDRAWRGCTPFCWPRLASGIHASPGCLAHLTAREAAGGERAHRGEGRVMPHSDSCCASRVLCRLPRQRSARGEAIVDMVLSMLLEFRIFVL